jgi:hypothetical protein
VERAQGAPPSLDQGSLRRAGPFEPGDLGVSLQNHLRIRGSHGPPCRHCSVCHSIGERPW